MNERAKVTELLPTAEAPAMVSLSEGWTAELRSAAGGAARLRVARPEGGATLEISIVITAGGPAIRAHAASLEIESDTDLVARCQRFRVEASQSVDLVTGGTLRAEGRRLELEATHGSARIHANDDVQLLGENVLLNCDPAPVAMPAWAVPSRGLPTPTVPVEPVYSGDASLADELKRGG